MPVDVVKVSRVGRLSARQGVTRFEVCAAHRIYTTVNPWQASFCQQAQEQDFLVTIGWRDTTWGPSIVTVDRAEGSEERFVEIGRSA